MALLKGGSALINLAVFLVLGGREEDLAASEMLEKKFTAITVFDEVFYDYSVSWNIVEVNPYLHYENRISMEDCSQVCMFVVKIVFFVHTNLIFCC